MGGQGTRRSSLDYAQHVVDVAKTVMSSLGVLGFVAHLSSKLVQVYAGCSRFALCVCVAFVFGSFDIPCHKQTVSTAVYETVRTNVHAAFEGLGGVDIASAIAVQILS